ncbi:MAG: ABC transporter permease [Acetobacteraceae bacterium]
MTRAGQVLLTRILVIIACFLLLEALCRTGVISPLVMIAPSAMFASMLHLLPAADVRHDVLRTSVTVVGGFVISVLAGFALGAALHASPRLRRTIDPLLASYYAVPSFIFYPLLVAIFGLNALPLMVIGIVFAAPAMMIATLLGLDRVPPVLRKVARTHRLGRARTIFLVVLPAAMPNLFNGIRLAFAYAFIAIIAGEFILSGGGLGYAIGYAYDSFEGRRMYGLLIFVLLIAIVVNGVLYTWEKRLIGRRSR